MLHSNGIGRFPWSCTQPFGGSGSLGLLQAAIVDPDVMVGHQGHYPRSAFCRCPSGNWVCGETHDTQLGNFELHNAAQYALSSGLSQVVNGTALILSLLLRGNKKDNSGLQANRKWYISFFALLWPVLSMQSTGLRDKLGQWLSG